MVEHKNLVCCTGSTWRETAKLRGAGATDAVPRHSDGHSALNCTPDSFHRQSSGHSTFAGVTDPVHRQCDKHSAFACATDSVHRKSDGRAAFSGASDSVQRQSDDQFINRAINIPRLLVPQIQ